MGLFGLGSNPENQPYNGTDVIYQWDGLVKKAINNGGTPYVFDGRDSHKGNVKIMIHDLNEITSREEFKEQMLIQDGMYSENDVSLLRSFISKKLQNDSFVRMLINKWGVNNENAPVYIIRVGNMELVQKHIDDIINVLKGGLDNVDEAIERMQAEIGGSDQQTVNDVIIKYNVLIAAAQTYIDQLREIQRK